LTGRTPTLLASSSAALAVALSLSACGGDRVDRKDLESKVQDFVQRQTGITVPVKCPDDVKPDKGTHATCTADLSGTQTKLDLLFTSKGRFQVHVDSSKLG
jgi:hypothetical protein